MTDCWDITPERGFLLNPAPLTSLTAIESPLSVDTFEQVESLADDLPRLLHNGRLRAVLDDIPLFDYAALEYDTDCRVIERLFMLYGYFASAYVYANDDPVQRIPTSVAVPLVQLSHLARRPPILTYSTMVLGNWRLQDSDGKMTIDNLETLQTFLDVPDEHWFILVHVAIEARAIKILNGVHAAQDAIANEDDQALHGALRDIKQGLIDITTTFHNMEKGCDPDIYYQQVRPYMFGFNDVVYEGVKEYKNQPMTIRGGSGAQSSIVPALVNALGIEHQQSELTRHLDDMLDYMPIAHRQYIGKMRQSPIRSYVQSHPVFTDAYNHCLRQLMTFRRAHFYYARTYIFQKSTNPVGTGGTLFMDFLSKLVAETEAHLL